MKDGSGAFQPCYNAQRRWMVSNPSMPFAELTVAEAADALAVGDMTAEAYAEALLARTDASADLNAFITLDRDRLLQAMDKIRNRFGEDAIHHGGGKSIDRRTHG